MLKIVKRFSHKHTKTIVNLQYIKNMGIPTCSDCIHLVESKTYNPNHSKCRKFAHKNLITGLIDLSFADINRQYDDLCGPNAKYKEVSKPQYNQLLVPVDDLFRFPK